MLFLSQRKFLVTVRTEAVLPPLSGQGQRTLFHKGSHFIRFPFSCSCSIYCYYFNLAPESSAQLDAKNSVSHGASLTAAASVEESEVNESSNKNQNNFQYDKFVVDKEMSSTR